MFDHTKMLYKFPHNVAYLLYIPTINFVTSKHTNKHNWLLKVHWYAESLVEMIEVMEHRIVTTIVMK